MAPELHVIYGIPFRVAVLERNVGFAAANNAAARLARGRLLLLLNSDVLAGARGWLRRLRRFHDRHPDIGALGPKLLFEDGSLQHAGIFFRRAPGARVWENAHYFKGMHGSLPAANRTRPVPAVTGACLMIDHGLYDRVGGLSGDYIQGDYEDSDLCLRLLKEGRRNWYLPNAELYHLEGRSYALARRQRNARYNAWLHSERWGTTIEAMMRDEARSTR
jgi:GT2 family glycosyltransferase